MESPFDLDLYYYFDSTPKSSETSIPQNRITGRSAIMACGTIKARPIASCSISGQRAYRPPPYFRESILLFGKVSQVNYF